MPYYAETGRFCPQIAWLYNFMDFMNNFIEFELSLKDGALQWWGMACNHHYWKDSLTLYH
jgi:hypothetical protein